MVRGSVTGLLLLLTHLEISRSLPAPSSVTISSYNMEHVLSFSPGCRTPSEARFSVQIHSSRKNRWKNVACSDLKAGQNCNLTTELTDVLDHYRARVRTIGFNQTSEWSVSGPFQPLSDTVLGPPDLSLSGCGDCLVLQAKFPAGSRLDRMKNLYWELVVHVRRTRDGAEFRLQLPFNQQNIVSHLQPGEEYCVSVSITSLWNQNAVSSKRVCAFSSRPDDKHFLFLLLGSVGFLSLVSLCFVGRLIFRSQVKSSSTVCRMIRSKTGQMNTPLTEEKFTSTGENPTGPHRTIQTIQNQTGPVRS